MFLKDCASYVSDRIEANKLSSSTYISTDNMLPERRGIEPSICVPITGKVTAFAPGDILLSNIRPYFKKIWIADRVGGCCADVLVIRADKTKILPEQLFLILSQDSFFEYVMAGTKGSKMPRGDKDRIMNYPIPEVNHIDIISKWNMDIRLKIETNNAIISELEVLAKDIYDYWFVQFDFPDENGNPYKSSGGKMVWNEELKREIPEGWKASLIENWCKIFTGKKDVNQSLDSGEYKFFSCAPSFRYSNEKIYSGKAILISGNGSYTGRTILVNDAFDLYQRTYACVMKDQLPDIVEYIYYTMKRFFVPKVIGGTHGSAIPYIVYNDIAKEKLVYEESVVKKFLEVIVQVQELISVLSKEINELSSFRDFLLPLLMNGQVKVGTTEA